MRKIADDSIQNCIGNGENAGFLRAATGYRYHVWIFFGFDYFWHKKIKKYRNIIPIYQKCKAKSIILYEYPSINMIYL